MSGPLAYELDSNWYILSGDIMLIPAEVRPALTYAKPVKTPVLGLEYFTLKFLNYLPTKQNA